MTQPDAPKEQTITITIDPSALDFYFEAMLPDVSKATREHMAKAILRGVEADRNKACLEARIDELEKIHVHINRNMGNYHAYKDRLKALQSEQKKGK